MQVYEVGDWPAGGAGPAVPYFALEFCAGGSLEAKLRGTPLAAGEADKTKGVIPFADCGRVFLPN